MKIETSQTLKRFARITFGLLALHPFALGDTVVPAGVSTGTNLNGVDCAALDTDPKHSCAYLKSKDTSSWDAGTLADEILAKLEAPSSYKTTLVTRLTEYSTNICDGGRVKYVVHPDQALKTQIPIIATQGESYFGDSKKVRDTDQLRQYVQYLAWTGNSAAINNLTGKVSASVADADKWVDTVAKPKFLLAYNQSLHEYCPENYKYTATQLIGFFKTARFARGGYQDANHQNILWYVSPSTDKPILRYDDVTQSKFGFLAYSGLQTLPPPDFLSKSTVYFKDNDPAFDTTKGGASALIGEITTAKGSKTIEKVRITASASSLNNTANFCRKDFGHLAAGRAETVKSAIKTAFNLAESKFAPPYYGGTNGDGGSSGPCAYYCDGGIAGGKCTEKRQLPKPSDTVLNTYQSVYVSVWFSVPNTQTAWNTPLTLSANRFCYQLTLGCGWSNLK